MMTFRLCLKRIEKQGNVRIKFNLDKLKDQIIAENFKAMIGGKCAPLLVLNNQDTKVHTLINNLNTVVTDTANDILGEHRPTKKPWVTEDMLKLCDKHRELNQKKKEAEGVKLYREVNPQVKKA